MDITTENGNHHSLRISRRAFLEFTMLARPLKALHFSQHPCRLISSSEKQERKKQILTKKTPSAASRLVDAIVIKDGELFFVVQPDGNIPLQKGHGLGLYYHDCRYLNGYELQVSGLRAIALSGTGEPGFLARFEVTNAELPMPDGRELGKDAIVIKWDRIVESSTPALHDLLIVQNLASEISEKQLLDPLAMPVALT